MTPTLSPFESWLLIIALAGMVACLVVINKK